MKQENTINVKALLTELWSHRITFLIMWVLTTLVVGAATYLIPRKYKSVTSFVPEYNLQETKEIRDIFYDLNFDIKISLFSDMIVPEYYAKVVGDMQFLMALAADTVTNRDGVSCTITELYPKVKNNEELYNQLSGDIQCKYSRKDGSSTISAIAKDPCVAQQMATLTRQHLENHIADYRRQLTQRNVNYYASLPATNQMAQQLLQMEQIRLQQHQPVFVVLSHANASLRAVAPQRVKIVLIALILVTLLTMGWCWRKDIPDWL